jgi:hypothetical protein
MTALADTVAVFRRWQHMPDATALYAALGTVAANLLPGEPVWLLLVGSPGSGKSEILQSLRSLTDVYPTATLTEAGLLSASPKRERTDDSTGGMLAKIGSFGILLAKDFGSVLSLHHDSRAQVLAALREVYDGEWNREVGSNGGRSLHWEGKVGLIAGCTEAIDKHSAVMGTMGERFVMLRLPEADAHEQGLKALKHSKRSAEMRAALAEAVATLFESQADEPPERTKSEEERLVNLAVLVVRCRSAVERDGYTREVELIPEPEAPARLAIVLSQLLDGLLTLGADPDTAWHVVETTAFDSIPKLRRKAMSVLVTANRSELSTAQVAATLGYPLRTTERTLDDLVAHGIADVNRYGSGKTTTWQISAWAGENYAAATSPDLAGDTFSISTPPHKSDFSGEVEGASRNGAERRGGGAASSMPAVEAERNVDAGGSAYDPQSEWA